MCVNVAEFGCLKREREKREIFSNTATYVQIELKMILHFVRLFFSVVFRVMVDLLFHANVYMCKLYTFVSILIGRFRLFIQQRTLLSLCFLSPRTGV